MQLAIVQQCYTASSGKKFSTHPRSERDNDETIMPATPYIFYVGFLCSFGNAIVHQCYTASSGKGLSTHLRSKQDNDETAMPAKRLPEKEQ